MRSFDAAAPPEAHRRPPHRTPDRQRHAARRPRREDLRLRSHERSVRTPSLVRDGNGNVQAWTCNRPSLAAVLRRPARAARRDRVGQSLASSAPHPRGRRGLSGRRRVADPCRDHAADRLFPHACPVRHTGARCPRTPHWAASLARPGVGLDCRGRVGADLSDGDHEDPHRVPLLGRLLGDQGRAEAGRARARSRVGRADAAHTATPTSSRSAAAPARRTCAHVCPHTPRRRRDQAIIARRGS